MELRQLTFARFIAAASIVVFHYGGEVTWLRWANRVWEHADSAVSFFFVLSGFILAVVYSSRTTHSSAEFYVARAARILPLYWLALVVTAVFQSRHDVLNVLDLALSGLLLQAWWPGRSMVLNAPGWSLSVEWFFYLSFPLLLRALVPLRTRALWGLAFAAWVTNSLLYVALIHFTAKGSPPWVHDAVAYHPLLHLATFVIGIAGGIAFVRQGSRLAAHSGALMLASSCLLFALLVIPNPIVRYHHNGLFAPLFLAFILGLASNPGGGLSRLFSRPALVELGEASYGVYILQYPAYLVTQAVLARFQPTMGAGVTFAGFFCSLVVMSLIAFRFVESPLRREVRSSYLRWRQRVGSAS